MGQVRIAAPRALYAAAKKSKRRKIRHSFCRLRRLRFCYSIDEDQTTERETTNCPPKRGRSIPPRVDRIGVTEWRYSLEGLKLTVARTREEVPAVS
jgi:hypothetical protein